MAHGTGQGTPPRWNRKMQQRLARGEAAALGELYDRFAPLVYGLALRVLEDEEEADGVLSEVFAYVWQHPDAYDPKRGPLRSFLAALAHKHAVRRLRWAVIQAGSTETETEAEAGSEVEGESGAEAETRAQVQVQAEAEAEADENEEIEKSEERIRAVSAAARADYIVTSMPEPLRAALELAYFKRRDYRQTAEELGVSEDEARRRLRLGLQLLATAHTEAGRPA